MNRISAWLRNRRLQRSEFNYQQLKRRIKRRTPEEAWAENGKAIRAIWQSVGDDIRQATKDYEDDLNAGD